MHPGKDLTFAEFRLRRIAMVAGVGVWRSHSEWLDSLLETDHTIACLLEVQERSRLG